MEKICALCGKELHVKVAYLDRGLSTKLLLCEECYGHKVKLLDFHLEKEKVESSKEYMEAQMTGKVSEIQTIIKNWIDGESNQFFPELRDLVYYVEGPEAYLFVFKNRIAVLSSLNFLSHDDTVYTSDMRVLLHNGKENGDIVLFQEYDTLGDLEKLNYKEASDRSVLTYSEHWQMDWAKSHNDKSSYSDLSEKFLLEQDKAFLLEKSFGEYGELKVFYTEYSEHRKEFAFKFFYYQNQLMEEVYNYILKRMTNPEEAQDEVVEKVSGSKNSFAKRETKKADEMTVAYSPADEIRKMKELFDCGILSKEEFDEAKKRLISKL